MSKTHLKTAHEWGVQQALEQVGYRSIEEVHKEAAALGLVEQPQAPAPTANDKIAELFRSAAK